jgi:antirestriction protein ArdC
VDGYTPKPDADAPMSERIESADAFFGRINARVAHQGNRAFYSPADDISRCRRLPRSLRHVDYYSTRAHETGHWTARRTAVTGSLASASAITPMPWKN